MAASHNVRNYRSVKLRDPDAAMPEFTADQRAQLADE